MCWAFGCSVRFSRFLVQDGDSDEDVDGRMKEDDEVNRKEERWGYSAVSILDGRCVAGRNPAAFNFASPIQCH